MRVHGSVENNRFEEVVQISPSTVASLLAQMPVDESFINVIRAKSDEAKSLAAEYFPAWRTE